MRRKYWFKGPAIFVFFLLAVAVFGLAVMLLWNALIPDLFDGPVLSYWQAVGLLVLMRIILSAGFPHGPWRHKSHHLKERWAHLSPEEREKLRKELREEWRSRCAPWRFREDKENPEENEK